MSETSTLPGEHAPGALADAKRALAAWVDEAGPEGRVFLQAHLLALPGSRYRLRHVADRAADPRTLTVLDDPYRAREVAQTTEAGEHRPLKTAPDLRTGWSFEELDEAGLWTALDYLYPACAVHWHAGRTGALRITSWTDTAARQSGMYAPVRLLPPETLPDLARACCTDDMCLRRIAWGRSESDAGPLVPEGVPEATGDLETASVPCPEACSMFISFARAVWRVERSARGEVPGLGRLNDLELEQIRALVEAAAGGATEGPRDGEFEDPLNRRRLKYLAARLAAGDPSGPELP